MRYKVGARENILPPGVPKSITIPADLQQPEQPKLSYSLPNPYYLRIHAACARIAHLSGAADCVGGFVQDLEETHVLASDGTSLPLLDTALQVAAVKGAAVRMHWYVGRILCYGDESKLPSSCRLLGAIHSDSLSKLLYVMVEYCNM